MGDLRGAEISIGYKGRVIALDLFLTGGVYFPDCLGMLNWSMMWVF